MIFNTQKVCVYDSLINGKKINSASKKILLFLIRNIPQIKNANHVTAVLAVERNKSRYFPSTRLDVAKQLTFKQKVCRLDMACIG